MSLALTAANVAADSELGPTISELMDLGLLDERTAVMVALLVQRMRGSCSHYAPWIALLPQT